MLQLLKELELYAVLTFYGIVGSLIRSGLNDLTGFEYGGILWANVCGCVIMGFHKSFFPEMMHIHIGTGLCGSITSFSSLIIQLFEFSTARTPAWNNGGYSVMAFLSFLIIQFSCCFTALYFGHHLGSLVESRALRLGEYALIRYLFPVLGIFGWIIALVCAICIENGRNWTLMVLFAPFGVWLRFYLSRFNAKTFKWGTFTANMAGTLVSAVCSLFLNTNFNISRLQFDTLHAIIDGLSGNLSTISTFINELNTLPTRSAYIYFLVSVGTAFICTLLIMGPYMWINHTPYL